jgi:hypothetical protein
MSKTHYHTTDGETLTRTELDRRISKAKVQKIEDQKNEYGYNFCVDCQDGAFPLDSNELEYNILDCSHIISVKEVCETGRAELCYDLSNIRILCRHHHKEYDANLLKFKK